MAWVLDLHPLMGVLAGSITLVGGHGTGAAYAIGFSDTYNIQDIMALAMMSATIGLIMGGVVGGPLGEWLLRRYKVPVPGGTAEAHEEPTELQDPAARKSRLDASIFIAALAAVFVCLGVGEFLAEAFADLPVNIPGFLWCLITGILIRNLGPFAKIQLNDRASEIIGSVALSLFLAFSMMTIDLASARQLAGPLMIILAIQAAACVAYAASVVFRIMRRDYEAVVISAAFCGFGMGATATAVANMQALSRRHGHAPEAFIVVPITGAFLVDILNVIVLSLLLSLPFVGG